MIKHTPGPWRAFGRPRKGSNFQREYAVSVLAPSVNGTSLTVAYARGTTRDEAEANARLIAEAPALLASLKSVLFLYGARGNAVVEKAAAAIAKAEG